MLVLFLLFHAHLGFVVVNVSGQNAATGLAEHGPGDFANLRAPVSLAFRASFTADPEHSELYWRALTLSL